jgi:ribonuclease-3
LAPELTDPDIPEPSPDDSGKRGGRRRGLLNRLRDRVDRYRELGRARRERLEQRLRERDDRYTPRDRRAEAPPIFESVPGTARPLLSAADYGDLENLLGYTIKHRAYFLQALTHRSYLQFVQSPGMKSNERLEFLGDSILNLVIAEYLYSEFDTLPEGDLTKLRSRLVSGAALVQHAVDIELHRFLLLSTSADSALKRGSATLLADAYEAVIAAIYLDGGMDAARDFIYRHIITHTRRDELMLSDKNYKSMLLEFVQARKMASPRYMTVLEEGPNHARTFSVDVHVNGTRHGSGTGRSKKEAEQNAARQALEALGVLPKVDAEGSPNDH